MADTHEVIMFKVENIFLPENGCGISSCLRRSHLKDCYLKLIFPHQEHGRFCFWMIQNAHVLHITLAIVKPVYCYMVCTDCIRPCVLSLKLILNLISLVLHRFFSREYCLLRQNFDIFLCVLKLLLHLTL